MNVTREEPAHMHLRGANLAGGGIGGRLGCRLLEPGPRALATVSLYPPCHNPSSASLVLVSPMDGAINPLTLTPDAGPAVHTAALTLGMQTTVLGCFTTI